MFKSNREIQKYRTRWPKMKLIITEEGDYNFSQLSDKNSYPSGLLQAKFPNKEEQGKFRKKNIFISSDNI